MAKILTANRLADGLVVFLAGNGNWTESIAAACLVSDEAEAARLLVTGQADERANKIIDPRLIDITEADGARAPDAYREAIRAYGPTVVVGP